MGLNLTTIVDGTTADAADVNQYKSAIETLAGAGWDDGAGDLTVEALSDEVSAARGSAASLDARLDAEHGADGTHKPGIIGNAEVAASAGIEGSKVSAATTTQRGTVELATDGERSAGLALQANDSGLLTPTQKIDLTDGGETTLHTHPAGSVPLSRDTVYMDATIGGQDGVEAASLPEYKNTSTGTGGDDLEAKIRFAMYLGGSEDQIELNCRAYRTAGAGTAVVRMGISGLSESTTISATSWADTRVSLDISTLSRGLYEVTVDLGWKPRQIGMNVYMQRCVVHVYEE